jgi:putative flippase GtrA
MTLLFLHVSGKNGPVTNNVSGYVVGLIVSDILNRCFIFHSKQSQRGEIIRFLVVFLSRMPQFLGY